MKKIEHCAKCGAEINTEQQGFYRCLDNYLQAKYFEEPDGRDNIFCSQECACAAFMIEHMYRE